MEASVDNVFASLMGAPQRTVKGKVTDDEAYGTAAWHAEMLSAAAAESAAAAHRAVTFSSPPRDRVLT